MAIVISGVNNNDKITATDGTIDLLSGVNYTGILTAPAFTATGNITAGHINIGSNIQLGNAGVATATTFVGNLTGNVNASSNLLLQIGGSEKFRVGSSGQLGIGGANYGTSGQVLTSGGSGSAATWTSISVPPATTINNNADNRVITGSGTANTLGGESGLTFDGTTLTVAGASNATQAIFSGTGGSGSRGLEIKTESGGATDEVVIIKTRASGTTGAIKFQTNGANSLELAGNGGDVTVKQGNLKFGVGGKGIDFSATGDASGATGELLNDYEEGTWSPLWSNSAANSGGTTTSNNMYGKYIKIGKIVHAYFYTWGLPTGNTGSMYLQGFPFQCTSNPGAFFCSVQSAFYNFGDDHYYNLGLRLSSNRTFAELIFCRENSGNYIAANFNGFINYYTNFLGTMTYEVS